METDIDRLLEYSEDGSTVIKCDSRASGDLNFPENAKRIADYAFSECDNLKSVTFPDNIISIGEHAFEGCKSLTTIYIGAGVRSIGGYAFQGCKRLVKIDISDTVESIGNRAFGCCHALKKIEIPKSVKVMGDGVFDGCTSLKNIIFDGIVEKMGNVEGWMVPGNYNAICGEYLYGYDLYAGNREYDVDMEINQDFIEDALAEECKRWSMLTIHIPYDGYKKYNVLLEHSSRMKELYLYEYLTNVTDDDLENGVEDELGVIYSKDGKRLLKGKDIIEYKIKDGTKVICDNAFERCKMLSDLILPSSIIRIGHKCFYGCGIKVLNLPNSVKTIGDFAFYGCPFSKIVIPESVSSIGKNPFVGCNHLKDIKCKSDDFIYCEDALYSTSLKLIACFTPNTMFKIPGAIKEIGDAAFLNCNKRITSVSIPDSVKHIGYAAFWGCRNIEKINIPSDVSIIGNYAFAYCKSLKEINLPFSWWVKVGKGIFDNCLELNKIIIPHGDKSEWKKIIPNYEDILVEDEYKIMFGKNLREIKRTSYDFSDDDISLDPRLW